MKDTDFGGLVVIVIGSVLISVALAGWVGLLVGVGIRAAKWMAGE